jgi:transposase
MKYSGIDLHSNNSVVVVTDESDRIIVSRRVPNSLPSMLAVLDPYRHDVVGVVVEATYNWYWLVDGLQAAGYRVHLANTAAIKRYEGLKRSGDEADAVYLAHLVCAWVCCRRATSARSNSGRCAIWPESACNWYARAPSTSWRWRTFRRARAVLG